MITLEGRPDAATELLPAEANLVGDGADLAGLADVAVVDAGLLMTLNSRLHCRRPMELVDPAEVSPRQPLQVGGLSVAHGDGLRTTEGPATYRCQCGFTMDEPALVREYAAAS
jgi:hypothetical protein